MTRSRTSNPLRLAAVGLPLVLVVASPAPTWGQSGTAGEWPYYAGDAGSTRYSSLDRIDAANVGELEVAWRWTSQNFGTRAEPYMRVTPLYVGGILFTTAGNTRSVVAIDAGTGETLWMHRLDEGTRLRSAPRLNSGRGVAYWSDGVESRVIVVTPAYHMVSLDAKTGRPSAGFGEDGIVDLRRDLGREIDVETAEIGSSSPPIVVGDVVVVGAAFPQGLRPPTKEMPPGVVRGYDARTGALLWTFHTIPGPDEPFHDTWKDASSDYTGNAGVWAPMSADLELGYVYLPVELGTSDYYGGHRPGDNVYSQSLVCLDASTGRVVWHFQIIHHGIWDYDPPAAPILLDLVVDGREIRAVAQVTKQAFTYVFDRVTGEPVWPIEERPVPQSTVPGERTSPTQPFPTLPEPFDRQGVTEDDLIDFTPELRAAALEAASQMTLGPLFTPPSVIVEGGNQGTLVLPGSLGGANWPGAAFDPETRRLFVPSATSATLVGLAREPDRSNLRFIQGRSAVSTLVGRPPIPMIKPPWGRITAIDMDSGRKRWTIANDDTPAYIANHPALEGIALPRTGRPERAGLLVTRTLLFAGTGNGGGGAPAEGVLRAHDKETGEIVAEIPLPAHQTGVPMTYEHEGRQYIVVAVAGRDVPGELVALALPR